jgi:hypothetical protein
MIFTDSLLDRFGATLGAASEVTLREATGDKSVTIDRYEKQVLYSVYPEYAFTRAGGVAADRKATHHLFNVLNPINNVFELHQIAIKYPKATGKELRLYFNRESNFYPPENSVWFIFTKTGETIPYIGFMNPMEWENLASGEEQKLAFEAVYALDEDDDFYQKEVHSPQAQVGTISQSLTRYVRDPSLAARAIKHYKYTCQANSGHETFVSAVSGEQYVEVHHLIPISYSGKFQYSLDVPENLIVLCPNCHRAIHFASKDMKRTLLWKFYNERRYDLERVYIGIEFEDLCYLYNAEQ